MTPKRVGACSKCDEDVFDLITKEPLARKVGAAHENAMRATFILVDGTRMDLTFCAHCLETLTPQDYPWLWRRVQLSWEDQSPNHPNQKHHVDNGIMALDCSQSWKDVR